MLPIYIPFSPNGRGFTIIHSFSSKNIPKIKNRQRIITCLFFIELYLLVHTFVHLAAGKAFSKNSSQLARQSSMSYFILYFFLKRLIRAPTRSAFFFPVYNQCVSALFSTQINDYVFASSNFI